MKKIISSLLVLMLLQGCIISYGPATYETSNTLTIQSKIKPEKQTFTLFLSSRNKEDFDKIVSEIVKIFSSWNKKEIVLKD